MKRRIDYIRDLIKVRAQGPERGDNPYADNFGIMPLDEMRLRLSRFIVRQRGRPSPKHNVRGITLNEVADAIGGIDALLLKQFIAGRVGFRNIRLRKITRVLLSIEHGLLTKENEVIVRREEPERKPVHVFRICISADGKPTIVRGEPPAAPKQMPKMFADLSLPERT